VARGLVQGVYFRRYVEEHAQRLGLEGYVRNLPDGRSVLVEAEGERVALERLVSLLWEGPPGAVVSQVDVEWREPGGRFEGFWIA
jgi:acylphosphatase